MDNFNKNLFRDTCPALDNKIYFNYGGQGPLPTPSLEAITNSWKRIQELGPFTTDVWPYIGAESNNTRRQLAQGKSPKCDDGCLFHKLDRLCPTNAIMSLRCVQWRCSETSSNLSPQCVKELC